MGNKEYLLWEFWNQKFLGVRRGSIEARVEPHSNALLSVHEVLQRPQFLSTDRHVGQGAVELMGLGWNPDRGEMTCNLKMVGDDPMTVYVYVPAGYAFRSASASGGLVENTAELDSVVSVVVRSQVSSEARLVLTFAQTPKKARL